MFRAKLLDILEEGHRPKEPNNPTYITAKMIENIESLAKMALIGCAIGAGLFGLIVGLIVGGII